MQSLKGFVPSPAAMFDKAIFPNEGVSNVVHDKLDNQRNLTQLSTIRAEFDAFLAAGNDVERFGIAPNRPADTHDFAFIGITPKRKSHSRYYRCSFCETDRKFSSGRVVLSSDGLVRLIGLQCWTTHLDEQRHSDEVQDLNNYKIRTEFERNRSHIVKEIYSLIPIFRILADTNNGLLAYVDNLPTYIYADTTGFRQLLQKIRPNNGQLSVERMVPDIRQGRNTDGSWKRYRPELTVVHQISGLEAIFSTPSTLVPLSKQALQDLYQIANAVPTIPSTGDNAIAAKLIKSLVRRLGAIEKSQRIIKASLKFAQSFLSPKNLKGISVWSQHPDCDHDLAGSIISNGQKLVIQQGASELALLPPPDLSTLIVPDLSEAIRLFTAA